MILKWIIAIIIIYLLYRLIRKSFAAVGEKSGLTRSPDPAVGEELVEDPLCHTYVPLSHAYRKEIGGKTVYFCSRECLERYGKK